MGDLFEEMDRDCKLVEKRGALLGYISFPHIDFSKDLSDGEELRELNEDTAGAMCP